MSKSEDCRTRAYLDSLEKAGFSCVELYPEGRHVDVGGLDVAALVLTGGGDLDPSLYGEDQRCCRPVDPTRDRRELALFNWAREKGVPVLGICRGMQAINVFMCGSLCQDIGHQTACKIVRHTPAWGNDDSYHAVEMQEGTRLFAAWSSPKLCVNSHHHQAIKDLGAALRAVGWAEDGIVEAVEAVEAPIFGVQWHPERLGCEGQRLFSWFYNTCLCR